MRQIRPGWASRQAIPFIIIIFFWLLPVLGSTAGAADQNLRTVRILVVGDQHFARQTLWKQTAKQVIDSASVAILELMGLQLEIAGYTLWRHPDDSNLYRLAALMVDSVPRDTADILIGFTYKPRPPQAVTVRTDGVTIPFKGILLVMYQGTSDNNCFTPYILLHEMVHLFGGIHVPQQSLMNPVQDRLIDLSLDPLNRRILDLTHTYDFARGYGSLPTASLGELAKIYDLASAANPRELSLLNESGAVYRALKRYDPALAAYRRLVAADSADAFAWEQLVDCHLEAGHLDSAIAILEQAVGQARDKGALYRRLAQLCLTTGDYDRSRLNADSAARYGASCGDEFREALQHKRDSAAAPGRTR